MMNQTQPKMATTQIECLKLVMHPNYGNKNIQLKWQKEKLIFVSSIFGGPNSLFETFSASPMKCFDCVNIYFVHKMCIRKKVSKVGTLYRDQKWCLNNMNVKFKWNKQLVGEEL